jgi:hypothetical protein
MKLTDLTSAGRMLRHAATDMALTQRERLRMVGKALSSFGASGGTSSWVDGAKPPERGTKELLKMATTNPWLASVLELIAYHVASTTFELYAARSLSTRKFVRCRALERAGSPETRAKMMRRMSTGDTMLYHDRASGSSQQAVELVQIADHPFLNIDIKGEAFWWLDRDALGKITGYWLMPSHWIAETPSDEKPRYRVIISGKSFDVPAEEIVWFRIPKVVDPYGRGSGIGEALGDELDTDEYAAKWTKAFFYNRARPDLIINFEEVEDTSTISRAAKEWDGKLRGHWKAHRPHFLGGKVSVHELSKSLSDIDMTKLRSFERDAITGVFGVPLEAMGQTQNGNRASVTMALQLLAKNVTIPRLELLIDVLQCRVLPLFDERLIVGYESPMPDDEDLQLEYMRARPETATCAEWRKRQGLPDRGDVDDVHLQGFSIAAVKPEDRVSGAPSKPAADKAVAKSVNKQLTESTVDAVLRNLSMEPITKRLDPLWAEELSVWSNAAAADIGAVLALGKYSPMVVQHLQEMALDRIPTIQGTTLKHLRKALGGAVEQGLDARRAGKLVKELLGGDSYRKRSEAIAISEVGRSANYGTYYAHQQSGLVDERQWAATESDWENVRDAHRALHGTTVKINEPFRWGADTAMFPGEFADPALNVRCRCTTVAVVDEIKSADDLVALARKFESDTDPWVAKAADVFMAAFAEQAELVAEDLLARAA